MTKAEQIKNTLQETRQRRETQKPVVYELKLQNLSKRKSEVLRKAFLEAKWLYNWLVSDTERLGIPANKVSVVEVKAGDSYEQRELTVLGSQIKQEIADRLRDNLRALGKLKKNGHKVGALKPKKFINSIPLKQYGVTYKLDFARNRVRIQNLGTFRVLGLQQIPEKAEIANGVLVRKPSGYYLHVTCYIPREDSVRKHIGEAVGIDFGVNKKLTLSNGLQIRFELHETKRQVEMVRKLECHLQKDGKALSWDAFDNPKEPRTLFQAIINDRKLRVDQGMLMADRPPVAVVSGPMTATFILAFAHGVADAVEHASVLVDGFGIVAMVAMTPIIALQILGFIHNRRAIVEEPVSQQDQVLVKVEAEMDA